LYVKYKIIIYLTFHFYILSKINYKDCINKFKTYLKNE